VLKRHQLEWHQLGIATCKLYYRRRVLDMPLSDIPPNAPSKRAEAMRQARIKILEKAQRKYLFAFEERRVPTGLIVDDTRLVGVQMSHTEVNDGRVRTIPDSGEPVRGSLIVSSIGSIPVPIEGIPQHGEVYGYANEAIGLLMEGRTAVYAAGNVLTGKGNIKDSLESGTAVGTHVAEAYLGVADDGSRASLADSARQVAHSEGEQIATDLAARATLLQPSAVNEIMHRVRARQLAVGYEGNYRQWLAKVTPPDLR